MTKILIDRSTVEQALEALKNNVGEMRVEGAISILEAALAQQAEPVEPVAKVAAAQVEAERERIFAHIRSAMGHAEAGSDNVAWRLLAWLVGPNVGIEPRPR